MATKNPLEYGGVGAGMQVAGEGRMPRSQITCVFLGAAIIALGTAFASDARACGGYTKGSIMSRTVIPADGATGVPTNVQIVVSYLGTAPTIADRLFVESGNGTRIPATLTQKLSDTSGIPFHESYVLAPETPLDPRTTYRVYSDYGTVPCMQNEYWQSGMSQPRCKPVDDAGVPMDAGGGGTGTPSYFVSSFTTGAGPDTKAPILSGSLGYSTSARSCDYGACCGPYSGYLVPLSWSSASDDGNTVFYVLLREGAVVLYPPQDTGNQVTPGRLVGSFFCSGSGASAQAMDAYAQFVVHNGTYQIVAVDLAGNQSDPISVAIAIDCPATVVDGGVDVVDSGANDVDSAVVMVVDAGRDAYDDKWMVDGQLLPSDGLYPLADLGGADRAILVDATGPGGDLAPTPDTPWAASDGRGPMPDVQPLLAEDAAPTSPDTGIAAPDASVAGKDAQIKQEMRSGGGCSCRVAGHGDGFAGCLVLGLGLLLAAPARRRRSRSPGP
jgi:hypothetical protein